MRSATSSTSRPPSTTSRPALWFGFLGGGVAWTAHLMLSWGISEFGCVGTLKSFTLAGLHGVAWLLLIVSVLAALAAAVATGVALRAHRRLTDSPHHTDRYLAKGGAIASGIFLFIILVESIPIFFYLRHC